MSSSRSYAVSYTLCAAREMVLIPFQVSDNPQTFHQALLLVSSLAHLAPEAVLRNVMPIFTFMGSSVLHRDDEYSFKVVQKVSTNKVFSRNCINLVTDHRQRLTRDDRLSQIQAHKYHWTARCTEGIFVHFHRRCEPHTTSPSDQVSISSIILFRSHRMGTSFFVHLTEVLGGDEFLAPISMLLVEKVAGRVVRQPQSDAQISLSIPLSILHHYGSATQVQVRSSWLSPGTQITIFIRHSKTWCKRVGGSWDMHSSWKSLSPLSWTSRGMFTRPFTYRIIVD